MWSRLLLLAAAQAAPDVAVQHAARRSMQEFLQSRVASLDASIAGLAANVTDLEGQVSALQAAADVPEVHASSSYSSLVHLADLPPVQLPELSRVQALSHEMGLVEHAWEVANSTGVAAVEHGDFDAAAAAMKHAGRDRVLLESAVADLSQQLQRTGKVSAKVRRDAHLDDIDPALLKDLHTLRRGAFLQRGSGREVVAAERQLRREERSLAALRLERDTWQASLDDMAAAAAKAAPREVAVAKAEAVAEAELSGDATLLAAAAAGESTIAAAGSATAAAAANKLGQLQGQARSVYDTVGAANATLRASLETAAATVRAGATQLAAGSHELEDVADAGTLAAGSQDGKVMAGELRGLDKAVKAARQRTLALAADEEDLLQHVAKLDQGTAGVKTAAVTARRAVGLLSQTAAALQTSAQRLQRQAADARADELALRDA